MIRVATRVLTAFAVLAASLAHGQPGAARPTHAGFAGDTLLIIRHAEKPTEKVGGGAGLSSPGAERSAAYADYFRPFAFDGEAYFPTDLVAASDSASSARPRLTLTPLSQALDLPVQQPFADDQVAALADWLGKGRPRRTVLIAWRHHVLPKLLAALGADPAAVLPEGVWPNAVYDWVVILSYDAEGRLKDARRIVEPRLSAPDQTPRASVKGRTSPSGAFNQRLDGSRPSVAVP